MLCALTAEMPPPCIGAIGLNADPPPLLNADSWLPLAGWEDGRGCPATTRHFAQLSTTPGVAGKDLS